jgi:type 1 fimbriae regulatory protein FimB/type 1 fimbriae regulatory protein FimE
MTKPRLRLVAPATENRTVAPRRPKNGDIRTREHLTIDEVERLIEAAKNNRYGHRDALMVLLAFRHGLRAAEVCDLRWEQVDFKTASVHVRRLKNGTPSTHPLTGRELRALRRHERETEKSTFVFVSERGAPLSAPAFSRMIERVAVSAKLGIKAHAHMLRHACGYKLANDGHDTRSLQAYLGHKNIQNTTRYTALAPDRFKRFWKD